MTMASKILDSPSPAIISNIWENLNDLSVNDPEAYNKISVESAKHFAKSRRAPLPFVSIRAFAALYDNEDNLRRVVN